MWSRPRKSEGWPDLEAVQWLRVLKLLLTVILLAIAVWNALSGAL